MHRIHRRTIALVGAGLVTLVTLAVTPVVGVGTAGADTGTGTVTGVITNAATGKPLKGMCVNVVEVPNSTVGTSVATTKTGVWTLTGVPAAADYTATAFDCTKSKYAGDWYDNQPYQSTATQFAVTDGGTTTGIDFSLGLGGKISGKVTDSATRKPVAGILVVALGASTFQASAFSVCTGANGKYKLTAVPAGPAKVEFLPNDCGTTSSYNPVFYSNAADYDSATVVSVTAGTTTSKINQAVTAGS